MNIRDEPIEDIISLIKNIKGLSIKLEERDEIFFDFKFKESDIRENKEYLKKNSPIDNCITYLNQYSNWVINQKPEVMLFVANSGLGKTRNWLELIKKLNASNGEKAFVQKHNQKPKIITLFACYNTFNSTTFHDKGKTLFFSFIIRLLLSAFFKNSFQLESKDLFKIFETIITRYNEFGKNVLELLVQKKFKEEDINFFIVVDEIMHIRDTPALKDFYREIVKLSDRGTKILFTSLQDKHNYEFQINLLEDSAAKIRMFPIQNLGEYYSSQSFNELNSYYKICSLLVGGHSRNILNIEDKNKLPLDEPYELIGGAKGSIEITEAEELLAFAWLNKEIGDPLKLKLYDNGFIHAGLNGHEKLKDPCVNLLKLHRFLKAVPGKSPMLESFVKILDSLLIYNYSLIRYDIKYNFSSLLEISVTQILSVVLNMHQGKTIELLGKNGVFKMNNAEVIITGTGAAFKYINENIKKSTQEENIIKLAKTNNPGYDALIETSKEKVFIEYKSLHPTSVSGKNIDSNFIKEIKDKITQKVNDYDRKKKNIFLCVTNKNDNGTIKRENKFTINDEIIVDAYYIDIQILRDSFNSPNLKFFIDALENESSVRK